MVDELRETRSPLRGLRGRGFSSDEALRLLTLKARYERGKIPGHPMRERADGAAVEYALVPTNMRRADAAGQDDLPMVAPATLPGVTEAEPARYAFHFEGGEPMRPLTTELTLSLIILCLLILLSLVLLVVVVLRLSAGGS